MTRKIILMLIVFLLIFNELRNNALASNDFENDLGLWTAINLHAPITKKFESKFQFSPRLLSNATDFNQFVLHSLLGYKFNDHFSFFQGYAWSTLYIPHFKREQRIYQEANLSHKIKKIYFDHRVRFEERFLQSVEGLSLRTRYRLKGTFPLDKNEKWSLVFFDEMFFNLNSHFEGPQAGIDQNRIYAGVNHKWNENISTDLGYQLQQLHRPGRRLERLNHFVFFYLNFQLPQLIR